MRTKKFTFKRTKRAKTVMEIPAIRIELTKEEAKEILERILKASDAPVEIDEDSLTEQDKLDVAMNGLVEALMEFTGTIEKAKEPRRAKVGDKVFAPNEAHGACTREKPYTISCSTGLFTRGNWYFADTGEKVTQ